MVKYCSSCGDSVKKENKHCSGCGHNLAHTIKTAEHHEHKKVVHVHKHENQTHGVPALLSFFVPGLGQLVKGQVGKAILFFIGAIICAILMFVLIGIILYPLLWLYNIYDAYTD